MADVKLIAGVVDVYKRQLLIYQGSITLFARALAPLLSEAVISDLSLVGNVLIFGVGMNVAFGKKLAVGNMLPALAVPVLWHLFV